MKVIVGLGNPGEKYQYNRHNVGFMVMEELVRELQRSKSSDHSPTIAQGSELEYKFSKKFNAELVQTKELILAKPQTFMNESGFSVSKICQFYKVDMKDLYIVHDDLDIKLGEYKIQFGKGPKMHNGLGSVEEKLGTGQFFNVRVGVENREVRGNKGVPGVAYSLQNFNPEEREIVDVVLGKIVEEMRYVVF